jgi:hypothetical protein
MLAPLERRSTILPQRPLRQSLLLSAAVIAVTAIAAAILYAATEGLWLIVHQPLQ